MTVSLTVDYTTLRREIGRFLGYSRDSAEWDADQTTDVADILTSGLRRYLSPPPVSGERYSHEWSFLSPVATLTTTVPYTTGTIGVASGVVTLSSGTFPAWAAQGQL